jgi:RimJ/RimL family protein N-acetyltransferase
MEVGDAESMIAGLNDPDVARFMTLIASPYTSADAEAWLERCRAVWVDGSSHPYAIVDAGTGEFLGSIEVRPSNGVIGYWVMRSARGRGIATRALTLICEHYRDRGLWLTTHPDNVASQRVAEKVGFRRAGTHTMENPFRDGITDAVLFRLA